MALWNTTLAQGFDDVVVKVSPTVPEPGQKVIVGLESFNVNLDSSRIIWYIKSQIVKDGEGAKSITFTAPNEDVNIVAQILTPENSEIIKNILISASSVDLLWEAPDTYTPPFYKGKALPGIESLVKFVAIPSASVKMGESGIKNVSFIWSRNDENLGSSSGRGRDFFTILFDDLKTSEAVGVATNTAGKIATAETTFKPFKLGLSVYPLSPGGEPFMFRALRSGDRVNSETSFFSAPYGSSPRYLNSQSLKFTWAFDQSSFSPSGRPYLLTITPSQGVSELLEISYKIPKSLFGDFKRAYQIEI